MKTSGAAAVRSVSCIALRDAGILGGPWPSAWRLGPAEAPPVAGVQRHCEQAHSSAATCASESALPERIPSPIPRASSPDAFGPCSFRAPIFPAHVRHWTWAYPGPGSPRGLSPGALESGLTGHAGLSLAQPGRDWSTCSAVGESQGACGGDEGETSGPSCSAAVAKPSSTPGRGTVGSTHDAAAVAAESACAGATRAAASSLTALRRVREREWGSALHYTLLANEYALHAEQQARVAAHAAAAADKAAQRAGVAACNDGSGRASGPSLPRPMGRQSSPPEGGMLSVRATPPRSLDLAEKSSWQAAATRSAEASQKAAQAAQSAREAVDKTMPFAIECVKRRFLLRFHAAQMRRHSRMRAKTERLRAELGLSRWWAQWRKSYPVDTETRSRGANEAWAFQQRRHMATGAQVAHLEVQCASLLGRGSWGSLSAAAGLRDACVVPVHGCSLRRLGALRALSTGEPSSGSAAPETPRLFTQRPSAKDRAAYKARQAAARTQAALSAGDINGDSAAETTRELSAGTEANRLAAGDGSEAGHGAPGSTAWAADSEEAEQVATAAQELVESAVLSRGVAGGGQGRHEEEEGMQKIELALQSLAPAMEAVAAGPWLPAEADRERIAEQLLDVLEGDGWIIKDAVFQMWGGERDGLRVTKGLDVGSAQLALLVLYKMKEYEKEHGAPPAWQPRQ